MRYLLKYYAADAIVTAPSLSLSTSYLSQDNLFLLRRDRVLAGFRYTSDSDAVGDAALAMNLYDNNHLRIFLD